jgi:hypothetical protein
VVSSSDNVKPMTGGSSEHDDNEGFAATIQAEKYADTWLIFAPVLNTSDPVYHPFLNRLNYTSYDSFSSWARIKHKNIEKEKLVPIEEPARDKSKCKTQNTYLYNWIGYQRCKRLHVHKWRKPERASYIKKHDYFKHLLFSKTKTTPIN